MGVGRDGREDERHDVVGELDAVDHGRVRQGHARLRHERHRVAVHPRAPHLRPAQLGRRLQHLIEREVDAAAVGVGQRRAHGIAARGDDQLHLRAHSLLQLLDERRRADAVRERLAPTLHALDDHHLLGHRNRAGFTKRARAPVPRSRECIERAGGRNLALSLLSVLAANSKKFAGGGVEWTRQSVASYEYRGITW